MLSYRHAFHAGNHADVLKHFIQVQLLHYLALKEKPFWYIDTHAGAGLYSLVEGYATKNAEYESGIGRLWQRQDLPLPLAQYVELVRGFNLDGGLKFYPGSPALAERLMRSDDRLHLFELHPSDHQLLQDNFAAVGKRARVYRDDGLNGLKALLPPQPRRGLILIDPPYEQSSEYGALLKSLEDALKRFATGIYAIWYPMLQKRESVELPRRLQALSERWLNVTLQVTAPSRDGFGMHGSGMFIINPPWTLLETLNQTMDYLKEILAQDQAAEFVIATHGLS